MRIKNKSFVLFLGISLIAWFTETLHALEPVPKTIENTTLQTIIEYSVTGEVAIKVQKLNSIYYEPEEMARLLSHWFSKIHYILPSPIARQLLFQQSLDALFEPKIKPKDNILRKASIDGLFNLVTSIEKGKITSSISLYLKEFPNGLRQLISHLDGNTTDPQIVASWAVILHYATENYDKKDISLIHDLMVETIKAYSAGADPDNVQNTVIVPNRAFFRFKQKSRRKRFSLLFHEHHIASGSSRSGKSVALHCLPLTAGFNGYVP